MLAIQFPDWDKPSLYQIKGGDSDGLMTKLDAARRRMAKEAGPAVKLVLCYEAGYDGFWPVCSNNRLARAVLIQSAWMWLRHQPNWT